jgi:SPP1 family predicted phage head-tail adaptor
MFVRGPKTTLTLQTLTEQKDAVSGITESWVDTSNITGVLTTAKGKEKVVADRQGVYSTHVFFCDKPSVPVTEKNRFTSGSRTFDIVFVDDVANQGKVLRIDLFELK